MPAVAHHDPDARRRRGPNERARVPGVGHLGEHQHGGRRSQRVGRSIRAPDDRRERLRGDRIGETTQTPGVHTEHLGAGRLGTVDQLLDGPVEPLGIHEDLETPQAGVERLTEQDRPVDDERPLLLTRLAATTQLPQPDQVGVASLKGAHRRQRWTSVDQEAWRRRLGRHLDQCGEGRGVGDGQVGEHLAVDLDPGVVQAVDEAAVADAVEPAGRVDALDPELAELALAGTAVAEGVLERVHGPARWRRGTTGSCCRSSPWRGRAWRGGASWSGQRV